MKLENHITRQELIDTLEVSKRTVTNWIQRGLPHTLQANRQYFGLDKVKDWIAANIDSNSATADTSDAMQKARLKVLELRAESEQIKIDVARSKLVSAEVVKSTNIKKANVIKAGLIKIKSRCHLLENKTTNQMEEEMEQWINEVLNDWSTAK